MNTERPDNDDDARPVGGDGSTDAPQAGERRTADAGAPAPAEAEGSTGATEPEKTAEPTGAAEAEGGAAPEGAAASAPEEAAGSEEAGAADETAEPEDADDAQPDAPDDAAGDVDEAKARNAADSGRTDRTPGRGVPSDSTGVGGRDSVTGRNPDSDSDSGSGSDPSPVPALRADLPRDEEDPVRHGGGRSRTPAIIASVAAAVLLIGGGGAWLAANASGGSGGGATSGAPVGDDTPPPLALDDYTESAGGEGNGVAPGEPNPYGATYRVEGTLPDGPGEAPVYRARGQVTEEEVARLAKVLGVGGAPVAQGEIWKVGAGQDGSGPSLQVNREAPGAWTYSRYAPGTDNCKGTDRCTPRTGGTPVSEAEAEKAAEPVLEALGQRDAKRDASHAMGARRVVNAAPEIGGLPTYGWTTGVTVGSDGEVVGGSGQLKTPVKGDTYPVVGAERALKLMEDRPQGDPRMGIGGCAGPAPLEDRPEQPCDSSATGAPGQDAVTVEKAVFGLASHSVDGRQALVPSWLFEVVAPGAKDPFTVTYPAVDPEFLASPRTGRPGDKPTSAPEPRNVEVDGYRAEGAELTVTFTGGVCSDYDVKASENGDEVVVTVTSKAWPDEVCILIAKQFQQTVRLDEPLGDREVVDSDGKGVPLAKEGARLPAPPTRER
ncbi:hypothetical protein ABZ499_06175 [Streptomyces sp. NPDC019990]|uniref:hypothetical protein n=1 Tax=Streptomyces sp. NPDC019990 TaxID=3154693 RepID=UPI00340737D7